MTKVGDYELPFDPDGNMFRDPYYRHPVWRKNGVFKLTLRFKSFEGMSHKSSQPWAVFMDDNDNTYPMYLSDAQEVLTRMPEGTYTGNFVGVKRSTSYGIKAILED